MLRSVLVAVYWTMMTLSDSLPSVARDAVADKYFSSLRNLNLEF
jgi:hypothetical protein